MGYSSQISKLSIELSLAAAGTYHIKFGATWGTAIKDAFWNFTLTQAVPAGGLLSGFESMPDAATGTWRVKSWVNGSAAAPIETVVLASGEVGTSLGVMQLHSSTAILNSMQNVGYGSARWSKSAFRQYLNKAGASWFVPNTDSFDPTNTPKNLSGCRRLGDKRA